MQRSLQTFLRYGLLPVFLITAFGATAQTEAEYIAAMARALGGRTEAAVDNGRVDILTATHAIEVERAGKWKNSIGQALWYALQTNKQPGIILILDGAQDYKHFQRLNAALRYAGLQDRVRTWLYPQDFPDLVVAQPRAYETRRPAAVQTDYWLTTSSKKRHRRHCRWYETSRGRYCGPNEGVAAGCCH